MDLYGPLLTEKQADIMDLYYNDDLSLAEIAQQMDITRQGVRDLVKRSETQLFKFEDQLGLFKRFNIVENGLEQICLKALGIADNTSDNEIKSMAMEISSLAESLKE